MAQKTFMDHLNEYNNKSSRIEPDELDENENYFTLKLAYYGGSSSGYITLEEEEVSFMLGVNLIKEKIARLEAKKENLVYWQKSTANVTIDGSNKNWLDDLEGWLELENNLGYKKTAKRIQWLINMGKLADNL